MHWPPISRWPHKGMEILSEANGQMLVQRGGCNPSADDLEAVCIGGNFGVIHRAVLPLIAKVYYTILQECIELNTICEKDDADLDMGAGWLFKTKEYRLTHCLDDQRILTVAWKRYPKYFQTGGPLWCGLLGKLTFPPSGKSNWSFNLRTGQ